VISDSLTSYPVRRRQSVKDKDLYQRILGIEKPWEVVNVDLQLEQGEVHVHVALPSKTRWVCPDSDELAPIHDHRERTWRHLDTCQYRTVLHARVLRLGCPTHGIRQLPVPWAEPGFRFTALFEALGRRCGAAGHLTPQAVLARGRRGWNSWSSCGTRLAGEAGVLRQEGFRGG
jgi:transposase